MNDLVSLGLQVSGRDFGRDTLDIGGPLGCQGEVTWLVQVGKVRRTTFPFV